MRALLTGLAFLLLATGLPARAADTTTVNDVAKAEREFAAETKEKGFHRGFIAWSTPDAIGFVPQAGNFHKLLVEGLANNPALADQPTPLRWWPYAIGVAGSQDMAFGLGPWRIDGTDQAGWFFTIWQKQADGSWKWTLDGRAGKDALANLPPDSELLPISGATETANAGDGVAHDDRLNTEMAAKPATEVFSTRQGTVLASTEVPPYFPSHAAYGAETRRTAALADRPAAGQVWTRDGQGASKGGDFVYTWGRATTPDGVYLGHYVRVWRIVPGEADSWLLAVDLFQKA